MNTVSDSLALVILVVVVLVQLPVFVAGESNPVPREFFAEVGYSFGRIYSVKLQDGVLLYVDRSAELTADGSDKKSMTIRPTRKQWRDFRTSMDAIKIWNWASNFGPPEGMVVLDGSGWSLEIRYFG